MKSRLFAITVPAIIATSFSGCSSAPGEDVAEVNTVTSEVTACPTPGSTEAQQRAAADLAFNLMRLAAKQGGAVYPCYSNTILASQRYEARTGGGIQFRAADPILSRTNSAGQKCVTDEMKAVLALAQLDTDLAAFLKSGLTKAYQSNGEWFPSVDSVQALANFTMPGPLSTTIADQNAIGTHSVVVSSSPWCNSEKVLITESVKTAQGFSPLRKRQRTNPAGTMPLGTDPNNWLGGVNMQSMGYSGSATAAVWSPFWGPSGNPYMIISVNGSTVNMDTYAWAVNYNCATTTCSGYLEFDPAPYAEPAAYYQTNTAGQQILLGTQANPFPIAGSLYASPEHRCDYAQRKLSTGATELGRFATTVSTTVGVVTVTQYKYAALTSISAGVCP